MRVTEQKMKGYITVHTSEQDRWRYVYRRVTFDWDTDEQLADEDVRRMDNRQLYRALDKPRRLRVKF